MKQILQCLKTGATTVEDVPIPANSANNVLIKTRFSLISLGTERMLIDFGKAGFINKARQQPDKVKEVIHKVKTDGVSQTVSAVKSKLDTPLPLGYCNVGIVVETGENIQGLKVGDRVVSNGNHAEYVSVPENLCARIPDGVADEQAVFTVLTAIALQGIRLTQPTIGETFAVIGLGLLGLLTVQLLRANGCRVIGIDYDPQKLKLAEKYGATVFPAAAITDPATVVSEITGNIGIDGAIITAATTSNDPVHNAAQMCRKRGRIILVGVTGLDLQRADFYEKELTFQVSCSYGPGRYDSQYEEAGIDYPPGYVRWTEQRNFSAVLELMRTQSLDTTRLISHRFEINEMATAYDQILDAGDTLGVLIKYPDRDVDIIERTICIKEQPVSKANARVQTAVIGAGNYTKQFILPGLQKTQAVLHTIVSRHGINSTHLGKKFSFSYSTTDSEEVLSNPDVNTVFITTRHDSHFELATKALKQGKSVFVEKPLTINQGELDSFIKDFPITDPPRLMIGYNRRFSPLVIKAKKLLAAVADPKAIIYTINSGLIPENHWVHDPEVGGGRIIGEACHFIDLVRFIVGKPIVGIKTDFLGGSNLHAKVRDTVILSVEMQDGSIATINYLSNGHKSFPKERIEIFTASKILELDNFKSLRGYGWPGFRKMKLSRQDKGQNNCIAEFIKAVENGLPMPIPYNEIIESTQYALQASK